MTLIEFDKEPYDGRLTDDEPQIAVVMSRSWWEYVRGAFERFTLHSAWNDGVDQTAATIQALDAMARMLGGDMPESPEYGKSVYLPAFACAILTAGGMEWIANTSQFEGGYWRQATPINNEDVLSFDVTVGGDSLDIGFFALKTAGSGIFRWIMDGVPEGEGDDVDLYSASAVYNCRYQKSIGGVSPGEHTFVMRCVGKHASSASYRLTCNGFWITGS